MKIRKATKKDSQLYLKLRKGYLKEYFKNSSKKITDEKIKKEFNKLISEDYFIFFLFNNKEVLGYLSASIHTNVWQKGAYIEDVFIFPKSRRKGYAKKLIKYFIKFAKLKRVNKIRAGVDINNKKVIHLNKKLGFKIDQYEMEKKIK